MSDNSVTPAWLDKGLWVAILAPCLALANQKWGMTLDAGQLAGILIPFAAYIIGHKWKAGTIMAAQVTAGRAP